METKTIVDQPVNLNFFHLFYNIILAFTHFWGYLVTLFLFIGSFIIFIWIILELSWSISFSCTSPVGTWSLLATSYRRHPTGETVGQRGIWRRSSSWNHYSCSSTAISAKYVCGNSCFRTNQVPRCGFWLQMCRFVVVWGLVDASWRRNRCRRVWLQRNSESYRLLAFLSLESWR